ncbi:hypothetical protein ACFWE3_02560 [Mycobacteriaceae bacterium NPDC060252]
MATWGISGPVDLLRRTGFLWWRCWPRLIGIWLVGWLARYWLIKLAVYVGLHFGGYWGQLIMPLAVLARLVVYVLMFLVLRSEMNLDGDATDGEPRFQAFADIVLKSILPVFVLFAAWKLVLADYSAYAGELKFAVTYAMETGAAPDMSPEQTESWLYASDWRIYLTIAVAFCARLVLTKFASRLPGWTKVITAYFEALWVFLLANAAATRLFGSPEWISERRIIVWYNDVRSQALSHFGGFADVWHWITGTAGLVVPAVLLSMTWLAIAGTVYATQRETTWRGASHAAFGQGRGDRVVTAVGEAGEVLRSRLRLLPHVVQTRGSEFFSSLLGIAEKLAGTIRLTLHAGPVVGCFFVLAFMGTVALDPNGAYFNPYITDGYLWRWVAELVGPHEWLWWASYRESIRIAIAALVDPLRICLVAAMYWHCLDKVPAPDTAASAAATKAL